MGLDATIYADDNCDAQVASFRIGNMAMVAHLRERISLAGIDAPIILTKVLASASHCGDNLSIEDAGLALGELKRLTELMDIDFEVRQFSEAFGHLCMKAVELQRPIAF